MTPPFPARRPSELLATKRTGNQIETLTARLNEKFDSALVRTAEAVESTLNSVNLQSEAMLGAVESARLTLAEIGDEASRKLAGNVEQLSVQFAGLERLVDEQDSRVRTMISHLSTGLAEVEAQV